MRAVVYRGVNDLALEELPVPAIASNELLVKVVACGVCPTDIKKIQFGTVPPPRIFGHETSGIVVRVGARVRGFQPGDRVALHHHVPCLDCHACRHHDFAQCAQYKRTGITAGFEPAGGGFAEYVRVMGFVLPGIVRIPRANSFLEGAMLEPVNTVLKAVNRLSLLKGDTVLVAGQGPIGLLFTRLLALRGMNVIATDLFNPRLRRALDFGATRAFRVLSQPDRVTPVTTRPTKASSFEPGAALNLTEQIPKLTRSRGLDAVVLAVASDELAAHAPSWVRSGGQVLVFSHTRRGANVPLDLSTICVDEKVLLGSYSSDFLLQQEVARLVFSRRMDVRPLLTDQFPLDRTAEAVRLAANPTPRSLKVVVTQKCSQHPRAKQRARSQAVRVYAK